jgi:hypothetical protein
MVQLAKRKIMTKIGFMINVLSAKVSLVILFEFTNNNQEFIIFKHKWLYLNKERCLNFAKSYLL